MNLFHGRIDRGLVKVGDSELEAPEWAEARDQAGVAYVRTYDVELTPSSSGKSSIEAIVRHIRAFGPVVRLELDRTDDGSSIEAHIPRAQYEQLALEQGTAGLRLADQRPGLRPAVRPRDRPAPPESFPVGLV